MGFFVVRFTVLVDVVKTEAGYCPRENQTVLCKKNHMAARKWRIILPVKKLHMCSHGKYFISVTHEP